MASAERYVEILQESTFDNRLNEIFHHTDIKPEQFQAKFPWLCIDDIERFRDSLRFSYPKIDTPLSSFMERVNISRDQKSESSDLPIDEFCRLFSITQDEAVGFADNRRMLHGEKPLANFIMAIQDVPHIYREEFARRHLNVENFKL